MASQIGKIGLIGAGAVGGFYGLMLKKGGEDIHFHVRSNFKMSYQEVLSSSCLIQGEKKIHTQKHR